MSPKRTKGPTFFNKKSEALNATILDALSQYCSNRILSLTGLDYSSFYGDRKDVVLSPQSDCFLNLVRDAQVSYGDPSGLIEAYAWSRRYDALFEKNASLDLNIDLEGAAYLKFAEAEARCKTTNTAFADGYPSVTVKGYSARSICHMIRRKITSILGEAPMLEDLHCSFGPGASTTCKKKTSAKWKLSSQLSVSKDARDSVTTLASLYPRLAWETLKLDVGEISFVPKSAKTHRSIMVEPLLNTFVQRGIGSVMKRRLSRAGCNLYDQSINREAALCGSRDGNYATVDLSSASDNISKQVVKCLLPWEWFELLSTWRTGIAYYKQENRYFVLEKFSSMGNGFTFELESCIFYATALVACDLAGVRPQKGVLRASVYGDDIIVPTDAVTLLYSLLDLLGFSVNEAKSFSDGPFRESCGGDFLLGVDVRPFYVKDTITDARLVAMSNHVCRSGFPDQTYRRLIESFINPRNQKFGPEGYGDGHLIGYEFDRKPHKREYGYEGYLFETFAKVPKRDREEPSGYSLLPSYICHMNDLLGDTRTYARESDVHVLRGGEQARVLRVYAPPFVR